MRISLRQDQIYSDENNISEPIARDVIRIMHETAKVHRDRDFANTHAPELVTKVNFRGGALNRNYMKIRTCTFLDNNVPQNGQAVVIYHLLKHRLGLPAAMGYWSVSIGFSQHMLPWKWIGKYPNTLNDPNWKNADNPYLQFAKAICGVISDDFRNHFGNDGRVSDFVIYDDVDLREPSNAIPGQNPAWRRTTRVGEVGWIAQADGDIIGPVFRITVGPRRIPLTTYRLPTNTTVGRPRTDYSVADTDFVETVLHVM